MNPLNRSVPPRSCTQTGVHVPILNVFDAFSSTDRRVEADPDVLDLNLRRRGKRPGGNAAASKQSQTAPTIAIEQSEGGFVF